MFITGHCRGSPLVKPGILDFTIIIVVTLIYNINFIYISHAYLYISHTYLYNYIYITIQNFRRYVIVGTTIYHPFYPASIFYTGTSTYNTAANIYSANVLKTNKTKAKQQQKTNRKKKEKNLISKKQTVYFIVSIFCIYIFISLYL